MKKLLRIIVLGLLLTLSAKADDIREFEIEGMSIGDSLLEHVSLERIKSRTTQYYPKSKKYVGYMRIKETKFYDETIARVVDGDKDYNIVSMNGIINYQNNISECYSKKKEIVQEIYSEIGGDKKEYIYNYPNDDSKSDVTDLIFSNGRVRVFCTDYSKSREEKNYGDHLSVAVSTSEYLIWLSKSAR